VRYSRDRAVLLLGEEFVLPPQRLIVKAGSGALELMKLAL
jgi:hypothetical protein